MFLKKGISQRECRSFYKFVVEIKHEILKRIRTFYMDKIKGKFFDSSYVFDVCLGKVSKSFLVLLSLNLDSKDKKLKTIFLKKAIKLLDFNTFGRTTDSLLFSWEELFEMEKEENSCCHSNKNENELGVKMRIVENDIGIHSNEYSMYSQPRESLVQYNKPNTIQVRII